MRRDIEEMRAGAPGNKAKDVPFHQALQDPDTRAEYIRRMFYSQRFLVLRVDTPLSRPPSPTMVDGGICPRNHVVAAQDALRHAVHGKRNAERRPSEYRIRRQPPVWLTYVWCRPNSLIPHPKHVRLALRGWSIIATLTLLSCK